MQYKFKTRLCCSSLLLSVVFYGIWNFFADNKKVDSFSFQYCGSLLVKFAMAEPSTQVSTSPTSFKRGYVKQVLSGDAVVLQVCNICQTTCYFFKSLGNLEQRFWGFFVLQISYFFVAENMLEVFCIWVVIGVYKKWLYLILELIRVRQRMVLQKKWLFTWVT